MTIQKKFLILASAILTAPLLITNWTLYPYIHGKTIVVMALALFGIGLFLYERYQGNVPPIGRSPVILSAIIFLLISIAVSIGGVNFERSFWGSWPRLLGLFHYSVIFCFAFVLATVFTRADWQKLMRYGLYLSGVVSIIAIMQKFLPILVWHGYRVGSTLDNPSFLAGYLIFFIFWGLLLMVEKRDWPMMICTALAAMALLLTRTRGAVIGLLIGLVITQAVMIARRDTRRRGLQFFGVTILALVFVAVFNWGPAQRLLSISLADTTVLSRLIVWKIAWQGFVARPFLGWGFENFNAPFNSFYNPILLKLSFAETFADKAHNFPLELLTTTGVLGVFAYVGIFIAALYTIGKLARRTILASSEAALFVGLLVANVINLVFLFDQLFTVVLLACTLGYLHTCYITHGRQHAKLRPTFYVVGILMVVISFWMGAIKPYVASMYNHRATTIFSINPTAGDAYFRTALQWSGPWWPDVVAERASALYAVVSADQPNKKLTHGMIEDTFQELLEAHKRYPYDIRFPAFIGYIGNWLGGTYYDGTAQVLKEALTKLSPARQQIDDLLVENYMVRGQYDAAISLARQTVAYEPTVADPHYYLGNALLLSDQETEAWIEFHLAEKLGYPEVKSKPYKILISRAVEAQDWPKVISLYGQAIQVDPENASLFAQLAAVYSRIGNKVKAIEAVNQAVRLNPKLKIEAEQFIKSLH